MNYHQQVDLLWAIGGGLIILGIIVGFVGLWMDDNKKGYPEVLVYIGVSLWLVGLVCGGISMLIQFG